MTPRTLPSLAAAATLLLTVALASCGKPSAVSCDFSEDCARPHEYCDALTHLCTPYECIDDSGCASSERCNTISNTCVARIEPKPDMGPDADMTSMVDMSPPVDQGVDLGGPDMTPVVDMSPPVDQGDRDRTPPQILAITPAQGERVEGQPTFTVTFDEALDPDSVSSFSFQLSNDLNVLIPSTVTYDASTFRVTLTPEQPLPTDARSFTLSIVDVVRDVAKNELEKGETARYYPPFSPDEASHQLAQKWAPTLYQELADTSARAWRHDVPTAVNFDGDWSSRDNLDDLPSLGEDAYEAAVYYQVTQTPSHTFITYILYYPDRPLVDAMGVALTAEHDFTGALFTIERESDTLLFVEGLRVEPTTDLIIAFLRQGAQVSLPGEGRIRGTFTPAQLEQGTHYPLYVPAGRHEACNWYDPEVRPPFDVCVHPEQAFRKSAAGGVILRPGAEGQGLERATQAAPDAPFEMTYALLPFEDHFWQRRDLLGSDALFDRGFTYEPDGSRPSGAAPDMALFLPKNLSTDQRDSRGKTPFLWLTQPGRQNDGQWLIDPAWTLRQRYSVPASPAWSYDYCYNVFLGIDRRDQAECMSPSPMMP